ncbi:MAG: hypothetical protein K9G70_09255 [Prolixibacteraceae bacterium]|nr:hypothetical protein [Prolixibacteraceae bacterium]
MKGKMFIAACMLTCIIQSCISFGEDDTNGKNGDGTRFLVLHSNDLGTISEGSYFSLLTIENNEVQYNKLQDIYPSLYYMRDFADINNGRVALGLHTDFNTDGKSRTTVGAWFDIDGEGWEELPLLPSGHKDWFSYFDVRTAKVSKSGHVFYLSSSNDRYYLDTYRASLVRYDPETKELKQATSPGAFAVAQPEKGWDTETANHGNLFFPSDDGRYVYGYVSAFGVDGGSYHWDYEILYRYDFDTDTYTRLGNPGEASVRTIGITSDRQYLAYTSTVDGNHYRNLVNTTTNNVIQTTFTGGQAYNNTARWNKSGYCAAATSNKIGVYNMVEGTKHDIRTPSRPYHAQYDTDGTRIYFMLDTYDGKYLCQTSDNSAEAIIDTLCVLQSDVYEFMVLK